MQPSSRVYCVPCLAVLTKLKCFCASYPCSPENLYRVAWLFGLFTEKCYAEPSSAAHALETGKGTSFLVLVGTASTVADTSSTNENVELQSYQPVSLPSPPGYDFFSTMSGTSAATGRRA